MTVLLAAALLRTITPSTGDAGLGIDSKSAERPEEKPLLQRLKERCCVDRSVSCQRYRNCSIQTCVRRNPNGPA